MPSAGNATSSAKGMFYYVTRGFSFVTGAVLDDTLPSDWPKYARSAILTKRPVSITPAFIKIQHSIPIIPLEVNLNNELCNCQMPTWNKFQLCVDFVPVVLTRCVEFPINYDVTVVRYNWTLAT